MKIKDKFESCGKYSKLLDNQTPKDRLEYLIIMYNSQNGSFVDKNLKLNMQDWYDEIKQIVKLNPELNPIKIKTYDLFNVS